MIKHKTHRWNNGCLSATCLRCGIVRTRDTVGSHNYNYQRFIGSGDDAHLLYSTTKRIVCVDWKSTRKGWQDANI